VSGRRRLAGAAALALLVALGAGLALATRLDRSPILGTPVAEQTLRALESAAPARERGALRAGWASAEITPPLGTPTLGYGARRGRGTQSVADPVFARALALEAGGGPPLVVLSADLCFWSSELSARVAAAVAGALPRERIYFGATHTHNGPGGFARGAAVEWSMGAFDARVPERVAEGAAAAVRGALSSLAPARLRPLRLDGSAWIENRSRPGAPLDAALRALVFERADGARAALVVFGAHATAIDASLLATSGDYPGALVRGLRARGFAEALFLAGATGQAGPRWRGASAHHPTPEVAWALGDAIAEAVAEASRAPGPPPRVEVSFAVLRREVALPPWRVRIAGLALRPAVAGRLLGQGEPRAHLHALAIDEIALVGHSFEFSAVLARELAARARERGIELAVTSLNGDHAFYVVPEADYDLAVYESGMTFFGPGLAPYLAALTERAVAALAPARAAELTAGYGAARSPGSPDSRASRAGP
jgi:hypothetical protein